ncbi:SOS response-associated peptidase [Ilumatobacter nonamiensis]|uniref:SOS response-associated peptidase n=1 Tax=Ilumatobacter nonamiensis TaxID=467093 RepID=UPI00034868B0|nr:SOS response-associated peptidase [Ilumatobacter nonamiensis]
MCGRFVATSPPDQIAAYFGADVAVETLGENFNVAPTHDVYGVVMPKSGDATSTPQLEAFHWGLIPSWAKDRKIASRMINARSETLAEKPAFKGLFKKKRLLVPMDGFYEWRAGVEGGPVTAKGKPAKQPMFIHRKDDEPLAVAGLWSAWKDTEAEPDEDGAVRWLHSATVVTTAANATMTPVHDRMPVLVPQSRWSEWLDPSNDDIESLSTLFDMSGDTSLDMHPVSTDVNKVSNNRADLIHEIDPLSPATSALF